MDAPATLAVDPGLHGCGVALFRRSDLVEATYVAGQDEGQRAEIWLAMVVAVRAFVGGRDLSHFVVELPQVYIQARQKGDPNDLIHLAAVVGGLCMAFEKTSQRIYLPAEWKGQVPKDIMHARARARLSEAELGRITCRKKSLMHNVLDAVALGLKFLGRL